MKNKKLLCSVCFLFTFMSVLWGQSITVKGNVTSKTDGQPVIGASVVEATATANGTITDLDGNFTLSVPVNSTLKITYIGYKPVTVKSAAIINVLLEEDTQMVDEVVVTGYTTQRKADLTGAVSVVKVDEIQKQGENNPVKALQGRVPGMNITADGNPSGSATVRPSTVRVLQMELSSLLPNKERKARLKSILMLRFQLPCIKVRWTC